MLGSVVNTLVMLQLQDMSEYQVSLSREIEARLQTKCDKLSDAVIMDDTGMILPFSLFLSSSFQVQPMHKLNTYPVESG